MLLIFKFLNFIDQFIDKLSLNPYNVLINISCQESSKWKTFIKKVQKVPFTVVNVLKLKNLDKSREKWIFDDGNDE